jgi:GNAT superfamily N-acetyltransferase
MRTIAWVHKFRTGSGSDRVVLNLHNRLNETPNIFIRLATAGDLPEVAALMLASFVEYRSLYTAEAFLATTPTSEQLASRMREGPIWVVTTGENIVGTISAVVRSEDFYIRGMAVLPTARGLRLGELLLKQVEEFAREKSCIRLVLSTTPFLIRAIRLYQRTGFQRTDEGPHDLFDTPLFTMAKDLGGTAV